MMLAWLLMAQGVTAPAAAAPAATPAPSSLQARFEAAGAALDAGRWEEARAAYAALLTGKLGTRTRGVVLLREGRALYELRRDTEARASLEEGIADVPTTDASLTEDRRISLLVLGLLDRRAYDYAAARRRLEASLALSSVPGDRLTVLLELAGVTLFDDNAAAMAFVEQAQAIARQQPVTAKVDADIHQARGRVLLNRGDFAGALVDFQAAVKDNGGVTMHTDLNDVIARSDAALAALKAGKKDVAHSMLAMTGEGRLPDGPFAVPAQTDLPPCGGELHPDDVAVVEFGIGDDGDVAFANPIYAARQGPSARLFAEAVSTWAWRAEDVKKIPLFYRAVTRIEMRCSTSFDRPADVALLKPAFDAWLAAQGAQPIEPGTKPAVLRAAIAAHAGDGTSAQLPYKAALAEADAADQDERRAATRWTAEQAAALHAPAAARAYADVRVVLMGEPKKALVPARREAGLRAIAARPDVAADARAADALRLLMAEPSGKTYPADAGALLLAVADDARLDPHDPIRVGALVRLASLKVEQGDLKGAEASYLRTGLSGAQCALVDAQPAMTKSGARGDSYPTDILMLGIDGWAQVEFDITADGRTAGRRVVLAFPPFVFGEPTVKMMNGMRFTQTYRPDGVMGCSGASQRFRYMIPSRTG